ncbi:13925_t:CDS:2, partial [Entrophospora sp. SA101]
LVLCVGHRKYLREIISLIDLENLKAPDLSLKRINHHSIKRMREKIVDIIHFSKADDQGPKFSAVEENRDAGTIISLELGMRTFMADYNPSSKVIEWEKEDTSLCLHYGRIQVLLPGFRTQGMVKKYDANGARNVLFEVYYRKTTRAVRDVGAYI